MWRPVICPRIGCFWSGIFSLRWIRQLFTFGAFQRWTCWHLLVPLNASIISPWNLHYLWGPWCVMPSTILGCFRWVICFLPVLVSLVLSKFLVEQVKGQTRWLILVAPCWMEAPCLPTIHSMLADVLWQCPIIKDLVMDVSVGQVLKGLPYLHLTLWLLSSVCYTDRGSLPQSVRQWQGQLECLCQRSTSSVGRNGQAGVLDRVYLTMPLIFGTSFSDWPGLTYQWFISFIYFYLFGASSSSQDI